MNDDALYAFECGSCGIVTEDGYACRWCGEFLCLDCLDEHEDYECKMIPHVMRCKCEDCRYEPRGNMYDN
jgi:hypothetical protein